MLLFLPVRRPFRLPLRRGRSRLYLRDFFLRRPVGSRLVRLTLPDGAPLGKRTYRLCVSNYRATGTGGYPMLRDCPVLWQGNEEVPELIKRYIQKYSPVPVVRNGEMKVVWK